MSALARQQREFMDSLLGENAPARPGLEVYRRTVRANLAAALGATYPVVRRLVGEAFFIEAARAFARAHPSRSGDLHEYGGRFADFLQQYSPARGLPYLPDVARLEWACHESHHAADSPTLDAAALARVAASGQPALRMHPSVRLLHAMHPVCAIRDANQPDRDGVPERAAGEEHVLVWREGYAVRAQAIERREWEWLARIARGATLEEAGAAMDDAELASFLAPALARGLARGVFRERDAGEPGA